MLHDVIQKALTTFIGRVVLAVFTLVVVPVMPALINFVNSTLGYNLTDAQIQAYATNASYGIAALASVWLLNNGLFERAALKVKEVLDAGENVQGQ